VQNISLLKVYCALVFFLLTVCNSAFSDNRPGGSDEQHPTEAELIKFDGLIIDSIEIENRQIFDTNVKGFDNFIFRTANKLHVKTQKTVIARELLLDKGDLFSAELAEESTRNLRNRYVIYDAWNEIRFLTDSTLIWSITTIDEWSFAGGFEISREGNEYIYKFGFEERNFLGLNQHLSLDYIIQEKDNNFFESTFRDDRIFGKPYSFTAIYRGNPKSKSEILGFSHPFYNLGQKYSYGFQMAKASTRNEVFSNSILIANSKSSSDLFGSFFSYRFGERKRNIVSTLSYNYNFERTTDRAISGSAPTDSTLALASFPSDSVYHQFELTFRLVSVDFTTFREIDGFGYTEDFTLGHTAAIGFARAFEPDFEDHVYDKLQFDYSFGHSFGNEVFYTSIIRSNKFRGGKDHQKLLVLLGNYYHRGPEFLTIAFRAKYLRDWRREGTEGLVLGGTTGIRGYPTEFRTGEKLGIASLEARFNPELRLLSAVFGFALFADAGRTWKPNEEFSLRDFYFSGGIGLRFALDRSSKSRFFRMDLAYSEETKWQISLSTGQYFSYKEHRLFLTSR